MKANCCSCQRELYRLMLNSFHENNTEKCACGVLNSVVEDDSIQGYRTIQVLDAQHQQSSTGS